MRHWRGTLSKAVLSVTLVGGIVTADLARAQGAGCNIAAQDAADEAGKGAGLAAGLAAGSAALMIAMMVACSQYPVPAACPSNTTMFIAFTAVNGALPMLVNTTSESGRVGADAMNSAGDCSAKGENTITKTGAPTDSLCSTPSACGCTGGPDDSPICSKDKWDKFGKDLQDGLDKINDPASRVGDGLDKDDIKQQLTDALASYNAMNAAFEGSLDPDKKIAQKDGGGDAAHGGGGAEAYQDDGTGGGSLAATKPGPADKSGLGAAYATNGLQLFDKNSEKELSIWQRATRRHQGSPNNTRGFFLARLEFLRGNANKFAQKKKVNPFAQDLSTAGIKPPVQAQAPAVPAVKPASVPSQQ